MIKPCVLCGQLTSGSVGAAGIKWTKICQECKNREDDLLLQKVKRMIRVVKEVKEVLT